MSVDSVCLSRANAALLARAVIIILTCGGEKKDWRGRGWGGLRREGLKDYSLFNLALETISFTLPPPAVAFLSYKKLLFYFGCFG
jgi:hypothetical protein